MKQSGRSPTEMEAAVRPLARSSLVALFFIVFILGAFICTRYLDSSAAVMDGNPPKKSMLTTETVHNFLSESTQKLQSAPKTMDIPLNCSLGNQSRACPANYYPSKILLQDHRDHSSTTPAPSCPDYFRWIHDDLWPWRETGITREMVMNARPTATFRLVILDGKAYLEKYRGSFQTRDIFTQWGILQLLRRYPGKVPDLDLMFDCDDMPVINKQIFSRPNFPAPPPLFRYCSNDSVFDIVFPDWSSWGWPEIRAKPWEALSKELQQANMRRQWTEREPYAYWKGSRETSASRLDLLKCNVSEKQDWGARVYAQDWWKEMKESYQHLENLASQCIHRYKIYIEGRSWSVSQKYIMACDSMTLLIKPRYYDFFTRSLVPLKHYWPIKDYDKCRSIKHAVEWGNIYQEEAQAIGKAGSSFILEELKVDYVYDYMFHLLSEYAKLLKYKPTVPERAVEVCSESMACPEQGLEKKYMIDSMVKGPASSKPCTMPPPYDPASLHSVIERKDDGIKQVDTWEQEYWQSHSKQM